MPDALNKSIELEELIDARVSIPTIPVTLTEINRICASAEGSAREASEAIAKDPAIAAKILRLVNSSFYALRNPIGDISLACSILGLRVIKNLVLQATVLESFGTGPEMADFEPAELWAHSFKAGVAAQKLVEHSPIDFGIAKEEAYTCGLVHDVGKMILLQDQPEQFVDALRLSKQSSIPLAKAEGELFGFSHAHVGGLLAERWQLSPALQKAITYHHSPGASPEDWVKGFLVAAANSLAHMCGAPTRSWVGDVLDDDALAALSISEEIMADIKADVAAASADF